MSKVELERSSMAFKLKDGTTLLISRDDVTELAGKLIAEMAINNQNRIYMLKNNTLEKCHLLYKIVVEQQDTMSKSTKEEYFKAIMGFLTGDEDNELQTLADKVKNET